MIAIGTLLLGAIIGSWGSETRQQRDNRVNTGKSRLK